MGEGTLNPIGFLHAACGLSQEMTNLASANSVKRENMEQARTSLNKAQMEFLQLLGRIKTEEELSELRKVVCDFYAQKIEEEMDRLWAEGKWDNEKNEAVLKEHLRTPYRYAK